MRKLLRDDPEVIALALIVLLFAALNAPVRLLPDHPGWRIDRPPVHIIRL